MASIKLSVCVVALSVLALNSPALAQQRPTSATLRIIVHDPSGAVIPGAVVQITDAEAPTGAIPVEVASDGQGVAVAAGLGPGRYGVSVSSSSRLPSGSRT